MAVDVSWTVVDDVVVYVVWSGVLVGETPGVAVEPIGVVLATSDAPPVRSGPPVEPPAESPPEPPEPAEPAEPDPAPDARPEPSPAPSRTVSASDVATRTTPSRITAKARARET